jgi:pimeloyl-ACP methyl ester carboxylesterase
VAQIPPNIVLSGCRLPIGLFLSLPSIKKPVMLFNRFPSTYLRGVMMAAMLLWSCLAGARALGQGLPKGFTGHFIEVNGAKIYYRTGGKGRCLVLLHGFPEDGSSFNKLMALAAGHYKLIVPDLRGIGRSVATGHYDAPNIARDLYEILKAEGISRVYVFGLDISGNIAYAFARLYPSMTQGVILAEAPLAGIGPWDDLVCHVWHVSFQETPRIPELLIQGRQAAYFREQFFNTKGQPRPKITNDDVARYAKAYGSPAQLSAGLGLYRAIGSDASFNQTRIEKFTVPIFLVGGENALGPIMSGEAEAIRKQGATTVSVEIIPKANHYLPDENPGELYAIIARRLSY